MILAALAFVLGCVYVWVVPAGLPYDEPSHWSTVLFYADHGRMPVLGQRGVTYEAQMGPIAYVLAAIVVHLTRVAGMSVETSFHVVRLLGVVEFAVAVTLVGALTSRLLGRSWAWVAALAVFALNTMLLTMSSSVQNDTLALVLGLLALELALARLSDRPTIGWAALVGSVAGLAVLTKLTAWPAVVAIGTWLAWRHRRIGYRPLLAFVSAAAIITGWWFVRNVDLYGDPTAAVGVHRTGVSFGAYHVHGAAGLLHIVEELVTYLWLPTEYLRNFISAPTVLKAALLAATIAIVLASILGRRLPTGATFLIAGCAVLAVGSWLITYLTVQAVAPRVAYMALPAWIALVAFSLTRFSGRAGAAVVAAVLLSLNAWALYEISRVAAPRFISTSSRPVSHSSHEGSSRPSPSARHQQISLGAVNREQTS